MKMLRLKAMGFLCGVGLFVGSMALAGGEVVIDQWEIERVLIPLLLLIVSAAAWFIRQVDRRLSKLSDQMSSVSSRISHIEGKLDISQTGGHQR